MKYLLWFSVTTLLAGIKLLNIWVCIYKVVKLSSFTLALLGFGGTIKTLDRRCLQIQANQLRVAVSKQTTDVRNVTCNIKQTPATEPMSNYI